MEQVQTRAEFIDTADQAKLIRAALKKAFPAVKFSVRLDRYAGGSSINISWTDGPTESQVEEISKDYQGGGFDGMIDMAYSRQAWLLPDGSVRFAHTSGTEASRGTVPEANGSPMHPDAKLVQFSGDYVSNRRRISPDFLERCLDKVREELGFPIELDDRIPEYFCYRGKTLGHLNPSGHECAAWVARRTATKPSDWVDEWEKPKPKKAKGEGVQPFMVLSMRGIEVHGMQLGEGYAHSGNRRHRGKTFGFYFDPSDSKVRFHGGPVPNYARNAIAAVLSWATGSEVTA